MSGNNKSYRIKKVRKVLSFVLCANIIAFLYKPVFKMHDNYVERKVQNKFTTESSVILPEVKESVVIKHIPELQPTSIPEVEVDIEDETPEVEIPNVPEYNYDLLDNGFEFKEVDMANLKEVNDEINSWIYLPDTVIDYPVCQNEDSNYYLNHNYKKEKSERGSVLVDSRSNPLDSNELSDVTYVYAHCCKNSHKMFYPIYCMHDQEYFNTHSVGVIDIGSDEWCYSFKIFAAKVYNPDENGVLTDAEFYVDEFINEDEFNNYINSIYDGAVSYDNNSRPIYGDKLIAFITCSYETDNSRIIAFAKLQKEAKLYKDDIKVKKLGY